MEVEDRTDLHAMVDKLLFLVEGLDGAEYNCVCSRRVRVGCSEELRVVITALRALLAARLDPSIPEATRFGLLEVE